MPAPGYAPALGTGHTEEVNRFDDVLAAPPPLPVVDALPRLRDAVRPGQALVLSAPPGSGKTTLLPLLLASATPARVLVTQPRRIAVRAAARRLASLLGTRLGEEIGYTVRGERIVGPETRIEVMPPGVLLRRLQADPSLEGVSAVMLDEFHERAIDTDLALAFLLDVRAVMREDLHLSLTSATLEAERTARLLSTAIDEVETLSVPGALHPLELHYAPARRTRTGTGASASTETSSPTLPAPSKRRFTVRRAMSSSSFPGPGRSTSSPHSSADSAFTSSAVNRWRSSPSTPPCPPRPRTGS